MDRGESWEYKVWNEIQNMNENQSHYALWYRNEVVVLFLSSFCTKIEQGVSGSEMQIDLFDFNNLANGCGMYMTRVVASLM